MSSRNDRILKCLACLAVAWFVLPGCKKDDQASTAPESVEKASVDSQKMARVKAKLALADAADGTEDHVVSKCVGCSLRMDGSKDHSIEMAGYSLHLCSDRCKQNFRDGGVKAVLSMVIPETP